MATLGNVLVPTVSTVGTYPLTADYPYSVEISPAIAAHRFGNKTEQRFYLGDGLKRYRLTHSVLTNAKRKLLSDFFNSRQGAYGQFTFAAPQPDGTTANITARFSNQELTFNGLIASLVTAGVELVEVPTTAPTYSLAATVTRFPAGAFASALLGATQTIIPLLKIQSVEDGYPAIYISDRNVTVGGQEYQARLLKLPSVAQALGGASDKARIELGNADRVISAVSNETDLQYASVELSLFHVGTTTKLDFWKGEVTGYRCRPGDPVFHLEASDGLFELTLPYPERRVARDCYKPFDDGISCPYAAEGTGGHTSCDKSDLACEARGMRDYFGGIVATPQTVRTKDNSKGAGRALLTTSSQIADSIYDAPLPQIYCNVSDEDTSKGFKVPALLASGRDEGDFYQAIGIIGAGPLGEFAQPQSGTPDGAAKPPHLLDGQPHHGWIPHGFNPRSRFGLRLSHGHDPVQNNDPDNNSDKFSLGDGAGPQSYGAPRAAGVAFCEIRRSDTKGLQLSRLSEHAMESTIRKGLSGWVWSGAGSRTEVPGLTNPIWIQVNAILRAKGLYLAAAATQELYFDVAACIAAADICDIVAAKLIGEGDEKQFEFVGVIAEERPLKEWLQEIANNCLGDYWFQFGKFCPILRINSSVAQTFTTGNMLWESLDAEPFGPEFNHLTGTFADEEYEYVGNSVTYYDIEHAKHRGGGSRVHFLKKTISLPGVSTKSRAARLTTTRTREELGGISPAHYRYHRRVSLGSTILALTAAPGMVCSVTHDELPTYPAANSGQSAQDGYVEFRVERIQLHEDYSVTIEGTTTHDDMYDLTVGPKPEDVAAEAAPEENQFAPADWHFDTDTDKDGHLTLRNFSVGSYGDSVHLGSFDVFYADEREGHFTSITSDVTDVATTINFYGVPPAAGDYIQVDAEIMLCESVAASVATVARAQLGTTAVAHLRAVTTVSAVSTWEAELTIGAGLTMEPGQQLVAPTTEQATIAQYDPSTGLCRTIRPITGIGTGQTVYADPRIYLLRRLTSNIAFAPRFFRSPHRAAFRHTIDLAYGGIACVRGSLENTRGLRSEPITKLFTADYPHRMQTGGTMAFVFQHPALPAGPTTETCLPIRASEAQPFDYAYAEILDGDSGPLAPPRALTRATPGSYGEGGRVTFAGTVSAGLQIAITLEGTNHMRVPTFMANEHAVTGATTLAQLATKFADWLNADPEFAAFYRATTSGAAVIVSDQVGAGGTIACEIGGTSGLTSTVDGLESALEILSGRRYACAFTGSSLRSDLGALSSATGATGSAAEIDLADLPMSADSRVTDVEIYATPDGIDSPLRLVATVSNGTATATDTVTETALAGATVYPGPTQASTDGAVLVTVKRDGFAWLELTIPANNGRSNIIEGPALSPVAAGTVLTIDVENNAAEGVQLKVVLE